MADKSAYGFEYDIRFITRKWAPAMGGMETYCLRLTQELSKNNKLDILALPGQENGAAPKGLSLLGFGISTAWRLIFAKPARIVHIADVALWPLGWIAKLRHKNSKIVISAHGSDISFAKRKGVLPKLYGVYLKCGAKCLHTAMLIANSNWITNLSAQYGFSNVHTVYLATDIKPQTDCFEHNNGLFFAGRILKSKGLSYFVNSVLSKMKSPPPLRVAGTIWDKEEAKILQSEHIEYLGALDQEALALEYANAMCVIVPSVGPEGFGLVAVEAAAVGGVVIGADHSGLAEVCGKDIGFKARLDEPAKWIEKIEDIRNWSDKKRQKYTAKVMETAQQRFSWERVAEETQQIYKI